MSSVTYLLGKIPVAENVTPTSDYDACFRRFHFSVRERSKNLDQVKALNVQDSYANDLSHVASIRGRLDALQLLAKRGMDIDRPNNLGFTPLTIAVLLGHHQVVAGLLKLGASPDNLFPLYSKAPVFFGDKYVHFFKNRINQPRVLETLPLELTSLQFATLIKDEKMICLLLENKANPNSKLLGKSIVTYFFSANMKEAIEKFISMASSEAIKLVQAEFPLALTCLKHKKFNLVKDIIDKVGVDRDTFTDEFFDAWSSENFLIGYKMKSRLNLLNKYLIKKISTSELGAGLEILKDFPLEHKINEKIRLMRILVNGFDTIKKGILAEEPKFEKLLNQLIPHGKLQNKNFGQVVCYVSFLLAAIHPEDNHLSIPHLYKILTNTIREQQHLRMTWSQYVSQKIEANVYKIDGFVDVIKEYQNAVIYPSLVNKLLKEGLDFRSIIAQETELDRRALKLALEHIVDDKSIGSLFRFNTLWHRPDMRLPDASCPDLENIKWQPVLPNGLWQMDSRFSVVNLRSGRELTEEGVAMKHCVSSRADRCARGESHVLSIKDQGRSIATVEVSIVDNQEKGRTLQVIEFRGVANQAAPKEAIIVLDRMIAEVAEKRLRINDIPIKELQKATSEADALNSYIRKSYVRPGVEPQGALTHYAGLKIFMNRTDQKKFLLGAFREDGYDLGRLIACSIDQLEIKEQALTDL